jgi:hypothetical protein
LSKTLPTDMAQPPIKNAKTISTDLRHGRAISSSFFLSPENSTNLEPLHPHHLVISDKLASSQESRGDNKSRC